MASVTISPSTEVMHAIRDRINSGEEYCLPIRAEIAEILIDPVEEITQLRCDIVDDGEEQLMETVALEDWTSHNVRIWIRAKVATLTNDEIEPLKLLTRQVFQRLNNYRSSNGRILVFDVDTDPKQTPDKAILAANRLFVAVITARVEVDLP